MAGRIPQEFIDELLGRVDIVDVIDARLPLRKAGREYVACCPFHHEKTPSFSVSPTKQFYHCFGCGAHGTAIGFLMDYEHLGFLDAIEDLAHGVGLEIPRSVAIDRPQSNLNALLERANDYFRRQLREHPARQKVIDYLKQRGLSGDSISAFGIGYAPPGRDRLVKTLMGQGAVEQDLVTAGLAIEPDTGDCYDRFRDRIMFPIRDRRGRIIAFGGRTLSGHDGAPKYLNSPETPLFHKGRELYGLFEARMNERHLRRLLVVEGYMDVVALAQHDIRYVVATLGTATTLEHLEQLFRITQDILFCFDGDRAGREAAWRALENALPMLRDGRQIGFLFLPEGEDPDSLVRKEGKQAFEQRLLQARPLSDYFFDRLTAEVDMHSLDGRARLIERSRPLLGKLPDSVFRDMMIQRLGDLAKVNNFEIKQRFTASSAKPLPARQNSNARLTRTPLRLAIALLLNYTELAEKAGDMGRFKDVNVPGLPILIQLIELLQAHPHMKVGAIVERFRDTETGQILERLAQWQPQIPETVYDYEAEFLDILKQLENRHSVEKRLLDKAARGKLNAEEMEILRNLNKGQRVKT